MAKKTENSKLRSLIFEMKVEGIINNHEEFRGKKMLRVCGVVLQSNFLDKGYRFCPPLYSVPLRSRMAIDDRLRVTLYCPSDSLKEDDERATFVTTGCKYELWDDTSEGWSCVYEKFHGDS